jgi:hypothetical protein
MTGDVIVMTPSSATAESEDLKLLLKEQHRSGKFVHDTHRSLWRRNKKYARDNQE